MSNRIKLEMTGHEVIIALAEGNIGAVRVLMDVVNNIVAIDPNNMLGWLGPAAVLDDAGIYGSRIWMLYKDVCGQKLDTMLAVLRAPGLGLLTREDLDAAIGTDEVRGDKSRIELPTLVAGVQSALPSFAHAGV